MNGQTLPYFTFAIQVLGFLIVGLLVPTIMSLHRQREKRATYMEEKIENLRTEMLASHMRLRMSLDEHTRWHMNTKRD